MQKGIKTTEFWLILVGMALSTYLLSTGKISVEAWTTIMSISIPSYAVARGMTKFNRNTENIKHEETIDDKRSSG